MKGNDYHTFPLGLPLLEPAQPRRAPFLTRLEVPPRDEDPAAQLGDVSRLPFSMKVLLENLLRFEDGKTVTRP